MIPHKDIRFVQQKAFKLLSEGKGIEHVKQLIASEGGDEKQISTLSLKYMEDYAFLKQETDKHNQKAVSKYQLAGGVFLFGGLILTAISYLSMNGQGVVYFWGLLVVGLILLGTGFSLRPKR